MRRTNTTITKEQAQLLANELNNSGGFTYDYNLGRIEPKPDSDLYAVGILPEYSIVNELTVRRERFWEKYDLAGFGDVGWQEIEESVNAMLSNHSRLLESKAYRIGGWVNSDKLYIDTVVLIKDRNVAIDIAKSENQISIFNLHDFEEIYTGGTGSVNTQDQ